MASFLRTASLPLLLATVPLAAQVDYAISGVPYAQNFTLPADASAGSSVAWKDNATFPGWFAAFFNGNTLAHTPPDSLLRTSGQGRNAVAFYLYHPVGDPAETALGAQITDERAPGVGSGGLYYGVGLRNLTGAPLSALRLTYRVELWRLAATPATQSTLSVAYRIGGTGLGEGTWTLVPAGVYTTPLAGDGEGSTARSLDGNAPANVVSFTNLSVKDLVIPPGETLWLRWFDVNNRLADHGLGIDDVGITLLP